VQAEGRCLLWSVPVEGDAVVVVMMRKSLCELESDMRLQQRPTGACPCREICWEETQCARRNWN